MFWWGKSRAATKTGGKTERGTVFNGGMEWGMCAEGIEHEMVVKQEPTI